MSLSNLVKIGISGEGVDSEVQVSEIKKSSRKSLRRKQTVTKVVVDNLSTSTSQEEKGLPRLLGLKNQDLQEKWAVFGSMVEGGVSKLRKIAVPRKNIHKKSTKMSKLSKNEVIGNCRKISDFFMKISESGANRWSSK